MRRSLFRAVPAIFVLLGGVSLAAGTDGAAQSDVLEAALKQQIQEHLDASERARGTVVCVGVTGIADATAGGDLLARLGGDKAVRGLADCERRPEGAVETATSRAAFIVTAGPIEWVAADEAWVTVAYYRTKVLSAQRRYRVVHERSGWVSLGPIMRDGPT